MIRIVSNPDRLRLLVTLGDGERTVSELVARSPGLSDQFVSRHLGILRHNGLVEDLTAGTFRIYKLTEVGVRLLRAIRGLDAP